jgi:hypothetical protein
VLYLREPGYSMPDALAPYALWAALWPIGVGAALAMLLGRYWQRRPRIPEGDVVVLLGPLGRAAQALGRLVEGVDRHLRHWPVSTMVLLVVALCFGAALLPLR